MDATIVSEPRSLVSLTGLLREELKQVLNYDSITGIFTWKIRTGNNSWVGKEAGSMDSNGYIKIQIHGSRYYAHHLAWLYEHNEVGMIDHKDGNPWNNAIDNLRRATYVENNRNRLRYNQHGYAGVRYRSGAYQAHIRIEGVITRIGIYATAKEAGAAYKAKAKELYGEFACDQTQRT